MSMNYEQSAEQYHEMCRRLWGAMPHLSGVSERPVWDLVADEVVSQRALMREAAELLRQIASAWERIHDVTTLREMAARLEDAK